MFYATAKLARKKNKGAIPPAWRANFARRFTRALLLLAFFSGGIRFSAAQDEGINRETTIKAAYLYNFAKYVEWPEDYVPMTTADGPAFVIGIVGNDPLGADLADHCARKDGRRQAHRHSAYR